MRRLKRSKLSSAPGIAVAVMLASGAVTAWSQRDPGGDPNPADGKVGTNSPTAKVPDLAVQPGRPMSVDLGGGVKMEFLWIPPGEFLMGSPDEEAGGFDNERPLHRVRITQGFWMAKFEVTQIQWQRVMSNNPSYFQNAGPNAPVEQVSWHDGQDFLTRLNAECGARNPALGAVTFRLPTEAEWEYACRAGTTTALYSGPLTLRGVNDGPELDEIAWYGGNSEVEYEGAVDASAWPQKQHAYSLAGTHPVGGKKPNDWGLYDMLGNVWEWCQDSYGKYPSDDLTDPAGPGAGSARVVRGGSWRGEPRLCRSANRDWNNPGLRHLSFGFRVVACGAR